MGECLSGCTVLVTGALGGIGVAITRRFEAEGAVVWRGDLAAPEEREHYLELDVTNEASWLLAVDRIGTELDILVNNAGVAVTGTLGAIASSDWRRVMAVNAEGAFLGLQAMRPLLEKAGTGARWASVINLSSILGMVGMSQSSAYAASKGAVRMLTKAAAVEFGEAGAAIRVNSLHPGFVRTAMTLNGAQEMAAGTDLLATLAERTPMRRLAMPEEIASAALFLASNESSFMTGAELVIDGGWTAQ
jgi:NAD(P)-dependent dehydrogenase (short-subunit alcohol dehydrogenase family)